jgi:hypothetical protein
MKIIKFVIVADARFTYNESGESTTKMVRDMLEEEQLCPVHESTSSRKNGSEKGCCCNYTLALYEDQRRKQPRDLFDQEDNKPLPSDITVNVRRSDNHSDFEKYKGMKSKVSENVYPAYDKSNKRGNSKILLT